MLKEDNRFIIDELEDKNALVEIIETEKSDTVVPIHGRIRTKAETGDIPLVSEYLVRSEKLVAVTFRAEDHPKVDTRWVYLSSPRTGSAEELAGHAKGLVSRYESKKI